MSRREDWSSLCCLVSRHAQKQSRAETTISSPEQTASPIKKLNVRETKRVAIAADAGCFQHARVLQLHADPVWGEAVRPLVVVGLDAPVAVLYITQDFGGEDTKTVERARGGCSMKKERGGPRQTRVVSSLR